MKVAYADPPYLGCCSRYEHHHPDGLCWDNDHTHALLIQRLCSDFPDGWALSLSTPSLQTILPMCPSDGNYILDSRFETSETRKDFSRSNVGTPPE